MASPKIKKGVTQTAIQKIVETKPKTTCIGKSKNTRYRSKNDKKNKKPYRGQGN